MSTTTIVHNCPITQEPLVEPVMAADGHTYEKQAIEAWLRIKDTSPVTGLRLPSKTLVPNWALKAIIDEAAAATAAAVIPSPIPQPIPANLLLSLTTSNNHQNEMLATISAPHDMPTMPVAIVAVLDVSGSMECSASLKEERAEGNEFSRLDLVKHSMNTAVEMLSDRDKICLVTFNDEAVALLDWQTTNTSGKTVATSKINSMNAAGGTNLSAGLARGMKAAQTLLSDARCANYNVKIIVLTDGQPTPDYDPPRGILETFRLSMRDVPRNLSVSTIAYGYGDALNSRLMKDIADVGYGAFSYVPDGSMVGTVFIHLVANAMNVCVASAQVGPFSFKALQPDSPLDVVVPSSVVQGENQWPCNPQGVTISRDSNQDEFPFIRHEFLDAISQALASAEAGNISAGQNILDAFYVKWKPHESRDGRVANLLSDVKHSDPMKGQISLSLVHYGKWGKHYLPALVSAHRRQERANFKDAAMTLYGGPSLDALIARGEAAFASIKPPVPSVVAFGAFSSSSTSRGATIPMPVMTAYMNRSGGCFAGDCRVVLRHGVVKRMDELVKGDWVTCTCGPTTSVAQVICVVQSVFSASASQGVVVHVSDGCALTEWHPYRRCDDGKWAFPAHTVSSTTTTSSVYNLVLDKHHTVMLDGGLIQAVTLGHGITSDEVVKHAYWGTHKVVDDLKQLVGWDDGKIVLRDDEWAFKLGQDGLVSGLVKLEVFPSLAECLCTESQADFIVVDAQHGSFSLHRGLDLVARMKPLIAGHGGSKVLVRLASASNHEVEVAKYLDAGADGVIAPMIETPEQAKNLVASALYPPMGKRSFGPVRQRLTLPRFTLEHANASVLILAMIETSQALENVDAILAIPGLGGIFIGPNDLAIALGFPPSSIPQGVVLDTVRELARKAKAKGKIAGIFCSEPQVALQMVELGYDLVVVATDQRLLVRGAQAAVHHVRKGGKM